MASSFSDLLSELDFREYHELLLENSYYDIVFPFLLLFAVIFTILSYIKFFQSKVTGRPYSGVVSVIALVVSWYGVNFELSEGKTIGFLIQVLFPNISALTIMILTMYIVGAVLGKDFFRGVFSRTPTAYIYIALGVLGLASVLFYTGISMGFWDYDVFDENSYWNFAFAVAFGIMGVVFLFIDLIPFGLVLLAVVGAYIKSGADDNILEFFVDPVIFIGGIFVFFFIWMTSGGKEGKANLARKLRESEESLGSYDRKMDHYDGRIHDIISEGYENNQKEWKERYGNEDWRK
ncbi:MAG: hypothetical protein KC589_03745 [Nanoarchaeota archaeon]|nr:hypothetical protein [Nanoarchaeota archaeon]